MECRVCSFKDYYTNTANQSVSAIILSITDKGLLILDTYLGEIAALGTAIGFTFGSTMFTLSGRKLGSLVVNRTRLLIAVFIMMGIHWILLGKPAPIDADFSHWWWLGLSGFIGFVLGDAFLFQAFVMVGPRLSMLMMALAPVFALILAWIFLDERLSGQELLGITITIIGIMWVVTQKNERGINLEESPRYYLLGILFALGGAMGQAGGLVTSKLGLEDDFSPISGNVIRLSIATIVIWLFTIIRGDAIENFRKIRAHPRAFWIMNGAVIAGPVVGVWLSLIAVQEAPVGIASTLMSLTPIFLIPVGYLVFDEQVTSRAVIGTLIAFIGTVLLFI